MTIQNGLGITGYSRRLSRGFAGQPQGDIKARPYRNALLPQITRVTVAGYGTDTDRVRVYITLPSGVRTLVADITRASSVPVDDAALVTAAVAAVNGVAAMRGHVVASADDDDLVLTFTHPNVSYVVDTEVTGCTATVSTEQSPGGTALPIGRFVGRGASVGGAPAIAALTSSSEAADVAGILLRPVAQFANGESPLASAEDVCPVNVMADVCYEGPVLMYNAGGAASAGDPVHVVRSAAGGNEVGQVRATADGVAQVATITPGAGQNSVTVAIEIRILTGAREGYSKVLLYQTDGSMTPTEVCDAFRTDLNLDSVLAPLLADTGTATLILTSTDVDTTFEVNVVEGTFTIDEATVAPLRYTIPMDQHVARWAEATPSGSYGPIDLRI